jgi:hypothetical protein
VISGEATRDCRGTAHRISRAMYEALRDPDRLRSTAIVPLAATSIIE